MNNRMIKADDIVSRQIGDETVIIMDNGLATHVLNKSAAYIWQLCENTDNIDEITDKICERFDVTTEEANADVRATIDRLMEIGLLTQP